MKTYLVTGGAGFIGSHVAEALLAAGHAVRIVDDFSTGSRTNVPHGADVIEADIRDLEAIRPAFAGVDGVFHVAALPRIPLSIADPIGTNAVNVTGTLNVLVAARDAKVRRVVYSASSSAYGNQPTLPLVETMPAKPANPYGLQKYVGELYTQTFHAIYGMQTVALRYFNVYGPRMATEGAYTTVIATFLKQKAAGQPLTVTGDGTQTRDFTHVSDVARANLLAMASEQAGNGDVINVGAGENHSVNEIAAWIGGPVEHVAARPGEMKDTLADLTKVRALLGWTPQVKLQDGIKELLG